MFAIDLPIAHMTVPAPLLLLLGCGVGFLSGMFGLGGGFLATPLLIFMGMPPVVAVASSANYIVGVSLSAMLYYWRREQVDYHIGAIIIGGGMVGAAVGVGLFSVWQKSGAIDAIIALSFVVLLSFIGFMMAWESARVIRHQLPRKRPSRLLPLQWLHPLPFKVRFRASRIYISFLLPLLLGFIAGIFAALLGIGGGLLLVPAMIYLLRMPMRLVVGTSLLYTCVIATMVTLFHAMSHEAVDIILAGILIIGGMVSAPWGSRLAHVMPPEYARAIMAVLLLAVAMQFAFDFTKPAVKSIVELQTHPLQIFAIHHPLLYGVAAVMMAVSLAWLADWLSKKE